MFADIPARGAGWDGTGFLISETIRPPRLGLTSSSRSSMIFARSPISQGPRPTLVANSLYLELGTPCLGPGQVMGGVFPVDFGGLEGG